MPTIIAKYSDFAISSIGYFIDAIEEELNFRDIAGLTNNKIEIIKVTKQHPLVSLMAAQLQERTSLDAIRSGVLPAISVTPGNPVEEGFTIGKGLKTEIVDDAFITILRSFLNKTPKETFTDVYLTKTQIELIISEYRRNPAGSMRVQTHEWRNNEEINISIWNETPDYDYVIANIVESVLSDLQMGFLGDDSKIQNMKWRTTKGLTNFNFGRVIFGTEIALTFMNTYTNYTIYVDDLLEGHTFTGTFEIPGE